MWPFSKKGSLLKQPDKQEEVSFVPTDVFVIFTDGTSEKFKLNDKDNPSVDYEDNYIAFYTTEGKTAYQYTIPHRVIRQVKEEMGTVDE